MSFELPSNKENIYKTLQGLQNDQQIEVVFKKKGSKTDKDVVEEVRVFKKPSGLFAWLVKRFKSKGQQSATVIQLMHQLFTENTPKEGFEALAKMSARFSASRNPKLSKTAEHLTELYQAALPDQDFPTAVYFKHYQTACKSSQEIANLEKYESKLRQRFIKNPQAFSEAMEITYKDSNSTQRMKSFLLSCLYEDDLFGKQSPLDDPSKETILKKMMSFIDAQQFKHMTLLIILCYCLAKTNQVEKYKIKENGFKELMQGKEKLSTEDRQQGYADVWVFLGKLDMQQAEKMLSSERARAEGLRRQGNERIAQAQRNGSLWAATISSS